jgi:hypothetical protein
MVVLHRADALRLRTEGYKLPRRARRTEANLTQAKGMRGARLTGAEQGRHCLKCQLWSRTVGKPDVRNLREGDGNVGIIRSPLRAILLPD